MKLTVIPTSEYHLIPAYNSGYDKARKLKVGEEYEADIKQPRNPKFHRKFFAMLNVCLHHQPYIKNTTDEKFKNIDHLRNYLLIEAGYFEEFWTPKGMMRKAKSMSFSKMDELEFNDLYSKVLDVVIKFLKCDADDFETILFDFL